MCQEYTKSCIFDLILTCFRVTLKTCSWAIFELLSCFEDFGGCGMLSATPMVQEGLLPLLASSPPHQLLLLGVFFRFLDMGLVFLSVFCAEWPTQSQSQIASDCQSQFRSRKLFPQKSQWNRSFTGAFGVAVIVFELRLQSLAICESKSLRFGSLSFCVFSKVFWGSRM